MSKFLRLDIILNVFIYSGCWIWFILADVDKWGGMAIFALAFILSMSCTIVLKSIDDTRPKPDDGIPKTREECDAILAEYSRKSRKEINEQEFEKLMERHNRQY